MRKLLCIGLMTILLIACHKKEKPAFSGYIDADLVYLSADFGGRLTDLPVTKGEPVKKGQLLFKLEQTNELYHVNMSQLSAKELQAQRQQLLIQLHYNELNYRRIRAMRQQNAASQNDLDAALRDLNISRQQVQDIDLKINNNKLEIADKKWLLSRKENHALTDGIIFDTYYSRGEYVQAAAPVLSLVTQQNIKAIFFVPEASLTQVRLHAPIQLTTDQNKHFASGQIAYIANIAEYTPPIIYSREERQRLVFRVEVHLKAPELDKIHLGQPVTVELG